MGSSDEVCDMRLVDKFRAFGRLFSYLLKKPETVRESFGFIAYQSRGLPRRDDTRCTGCGACNERCSSGATSIKDYEGMRTVSIDSLRCIFCARCADICPEGALCLMFGSIHSEYGLHDSLPLNSTTSGEGWECMHDKDLAIAESEEYARSLSLAHDLHTPAITVDTDLKLQKCRVCGEQMPVTEKFLQGMATRMLTNLNPDTAEIVKKDLELYLTACISCRQQLSVRWNTHPRKFI